MRQAITDPRLLGGAFPRKPGEPDTWVAWKTMAIASAGEKLRAKELPIFQKLTMREAPPTERAKEIIVVKPRRGGGTTWAAAMVTYSAALIDYSGVLGIGERGVALLMAPTQRQADVAFKRIEGLLDSSALASMIVERTNHSIRLNNGIDIEVHPASYRSVRGYTLVCAFIDEASFLQAEGRNTDTEVANATRPALITTKGQLILASTPYAPKGVFYQQFDRYYGKDNASVLVAKATWRDTNPTLGEEYIAEEMARDPVAARSEYEGEFRTDVTGFIDRETINACVDEGVTERPPVGGHVAFADCASGLSETADGDSYTLSIGHATDDGTVIIDLAREWKPPFSASDITRQVSELLRLYGVDELTTDGFSSGFVRSELARHGIGHKISELNKSELYLSTLPMLTSGRVKLLDMDTLVDQFAALERSPGANGRDKVDARNHEDLANSVAGVIAMLSAVNPVAGWGMLEWMRRQSEAAKAKQELPPTPANEHAAEAVMQLGTKRPTDHVPVRIPGEPSHVYGRSGVAYMTDVIDGERVAWMSPDDAWEFISSPLNVVAFEMNAELRNRIGKSLRQPRGIRISDMLAAIEDAAPPHPTDTARIAAQSLAMMARAR